MVFEVFAEGGSLKIESKYTGENQGFNYFLNHNEMDTSESGLDVNETNVFDNFYEPFDIINSKYPWCNLHLSFVDADFREYVADELVKKLNEKSIFKLRKKELLEEKLECEFKITEKPEIGGLQNISVKSLIKVTEHNYQEFYDDYAKDIVQKFKLKGSYEMWTQEQPYFSNKMEVINDDNSFDFIGNIEVSGNTIILKDEHKQISFVLPSDKYFVSAEPAFVIREWSVFMRDRGIENLSFEIKF